MSYTLKLCKKMRSFNFMDRFCNSNCTIDEQHLEIHKIDWCKSINCKLQSRFFKSITRNGKKLTPKIWQWLRTAAWDWSKHNSHEVRFSRWQCVVLRHENAFLNAFFLPSVQIILLIFFLNILSATVCNPRNVQRNHL